MTYTIYTEEDFERMLAEEQERMRMENGIVR